MAVYYVVSVHTDTHATRIDHRGAFIKLFSPVSPVLCLPLWPGSEKGRRRGGGEGGGVAGALYEDGLGLFVGGFAQVAPNRAYCFRLALCQHLPCLY